MAAFGSGGSRRFSAPAVTLVLILIAACASAHSLFQAPFRAYVPLPPGIGALALGDFDGDGALDLAVGNDQVNSVAILLNAGAREFRPPSYLASLGYSAAVLAADLDGDGHLDLVIGDRYGSEVSVFLGQGDGSFRPRADYRTGREPRSIAIGDIDGDGRLDLVVANTETFYGRSVSVLRGNGDGTFRPRIDTSTDGVSPRTIALADFDEDGRLDLVAGYEGGGTFVYVMRGLGDGRFGPLEGYDSAYGPITVATGDVNEDGHQDFVVGGYYDGAVSVHLGRGDGTFATKVEIPVPGAAFSTLAASIAMDTSTC